MCCAWLWADYWESIGHPEAWGGILAALFAASATVLSVVIAALLTYYFTRRQSANTHNAHIDADRLRRRIDALEHVWGLMGYMSQQRSDVAIIRWQRDRKVSNKKQYSFHFGNLERFYLHEVSQVFYKHHAGLHLPAAIRDQVFGYLHEVAKLYFRHKDDAGVSADTVIAVESDAFAEDLQVRYQQLNKDLRAALDVAYKELSV